MEEVKKIFLRRKQVSLMLSISEKTVDRLIRNGKLKASKQNHMVLIHAESVTKENILSIKPNFNNKF